MRRFALPLLAVPLLALMGPTGGYPTNPQFQTVKVSGLSTTAGITNTGAVATSTLTSSGAATLASLGVTGAATLASLSVTGAGTISNGLTVAGTGAATGFFNSTNANGSYICTQNSGANDVCVGSALSLDGGLLADSAIAAQGAHALHLDTNGLARVNVAATGNVTISTPTSGSGLTVGAAADTANAILVNAKGAGSSAVQINNAGAEALCFTINTSGATNACGAPNGTVGIYAVAGTTINLVSTGGAAVNGVRVPVTSYGLCIASSGGVASGSSNSNLAGCTHTGTGTYNYTFPTAYAKPPICSLTNSGAGFAASTSGSVSGGSVISYSTAGAASDASSVMIVCTGI